MHDTGKAVVVVFAILVVVAGYGLMLWRAWLLDPAYAMSIVAYTGSALLAKFLVEAVQ